MTPENHPRAVQLPLGCPRRNADQFGDLPMLVPLDVVQDEHLPRGIRQAADGGLEVDGKNTVLWRNRQSPQLVLVVILPAPPASLALVLDDDVDREPVQPSAELRIPAETVESLPRADEDVLREVLGQLESRHPARERVDSGDVKAVQAFECLSVTLARQGNVCRFSVNRLSRNRRLDQARLASSGPRPAGWGFIHSP